MSLLWPDRLTIFLHPQRLLIERAGGRWRARQSEKTLVTVAPAEDDAAPWRPMVDTLRTLVDQEKLQGKEITLVLSNQFAHYLLVPGSELLKDHQEELLFAHQNFRRFYGSVADQWDVRITDAPPGEPRLACGIGKELVAALDDTMQRAGNRYVSLQPLLMHSFNTWRRQIGKKAGWFVEVEPGVLCIAAVQAGNWRTVAVSRSIHNWTEQLPDLLDRETSLGDLENQGNSVLLLLGDDSRPRLSKAGPWHFEYLEPQPHGGVSSGANAILRSGAAG